MLYSTSVGLSSAMYPHGPTEKVLKGVFNCPHGPTEYIFEGLFYSPVARCVAWCCGGGHVKWCHEVAKAVRASSQSIF